MGCFFGRDLSIPLVIWEIRQEVFELDRKMLRACRDGNLALVKLIISNGAGSGWDCGLACACEGGHLPIVELMIEKGATDLNWGLHMACEGGHLSTVKFVVEKGATAFNVGMCEACFGG